MADATGRKVTDLKRVLREVRIAHAERNDGVIELREAEQARLELLGEALEPLYDDLPQDADQLLLGILPGQPPRYWVDATSFVVMARDKRHYQFAKDTRAGRTIIAESAGVEPIADAVTRYIAERIVERDQALAADPTLPRRRGRRAVVTPAPRGRSENLSVVWGLAGFGLGVICGMFLLLAYAWFTVG